MQISLNKSIATKPASQPANEPMAQSGSKSKSKRKATPFGTPVFVIMLVIAFAWGWLNRGEYITAESGLGYALGILGAVAILVLLVYPLRKRIRLLRALGAIPLWFRLHMEFGLIGPMLILYHANFGHGSTNSNVALWSMLIVAASGVVGRYFYTKIHRGLYGKRAEVRKLVASASHIRETLGGEVAGDIKDSIDDLEKKAFSPPTGMVGAARQAIIITAQARRLHGRLRRTIKQGLKTAKKSGNKRVVSECREHLAFYDQYFQRVEQAAELSFYEKLFGAWHVLHLPLFFLLIITVIIHVIAVHLY